jgi:hypothetical protein
LEGGVLKGWREGQIEYHDDRDNEGSFLCFRKSGGDSYAGACFDDGTYARAVASGC